MINGFCKLYKYSFAKPNSLTTNMVILNLIVFLLLFMISLVNWFDRNAAKINKI